MEKQQIVDRVNKWFEDNIDKEVVEAKTRETLAYIKQFGSPDDDGDWVVIVHQIVPGSCGVHTTRFAVEQVLYIMSGDSLDDPDFSEELLGIFDTIGVELSATFAAAFPQMPGFFYVGHYEADGSICVMYAEPAQITA